ncbi:hypothetical protein M422DRAFT_39231, partial [Sphaerobolus stellatus SS14]
MDNLLGRYYRPLYLGGSCAFRGFCDRRVLKVLMIDARSDIYVADTSRFPLPRDYFSLGPNRLKRMHLFERYGVIGSLGLSILAGAECLNGLSI